MQILQSANVLEGIRTPDPRLRRPLLYPTELRTHNIALAISKRVMGIEPTYPAWKAGVLPLNYTRMFIYEAGRPLKMVSCEMPRTGIEPVTRGFSVLCSTN